MAEFTDNCTPGNLPKARACVHEIKNVYVSIAFITFFDAFLFFSGIRILLERNGNKRWRPLVILV